MITTIGRTMYRIEARRRWIGVRILPFRKPGILVVSFLLLLLAGAYLLIRTSGLEAIAMPLYAVSFTLLGLFGFWKIRHRECDDLTKIDRLHQFMLLGGIAIGIVGLVFSTIA